MVYVLHPYRRASIASIFIFGSVGRKARERRYRLMRIQHARVHLAISTGMSGVSITAFPRKVKEFTCL